MSARASTSATPSRDEERAHRRRREAARAIRDWLRGDLSQERCLHKLRHAGPWPLGLDVAHYLEAHVASPMPGPPTAAQRREAERVMRFLLTASPYRWAVPGKPPLLGRLGCSLGLTGVFSLTVLPLMSLPFVLFFWNATLLLYLVGAPIVVGLLLIALCSGLLRIAIRGHARRLDAIWADPRSISDKPLDFTAYPFASRDELRRAQAACPDVHAACESDKDGRDAPRASGT